ncbi:MAG: 50S ribosomal protein L20 [Chitinispirillales bacterium]|jgi:large subunit ribosomal protein L20|nr:50S ribosomal protein L20 [Chitinispirillales bacterium]
MPRAKTRVASRARRKKIISQTAGYFGKRKNCIRVATDAMYHAGTYAYRDRKQNKRNFRCLWIMRINAAARLNGTTYGKLICGLKAKGIELDRKSLANLALHEPDAFAKLVSEVAA